jgi:two-component system chemotaxis response regulator CheY
MAIPVLIVDDSAISRKMMSRALPAGIDYEITEAANGEEALSAWRAGKGDVILLDLTMPIMDGYTTLEKIKAEGVKTFVVVVSADIQPKAEERVKKLGAVAFMKKPIDKKALATVLKKYGPPQ